MQGEQPLQTASQVLKYPGRATEAVYKGELTLVSASTSQKRNDPTKANKPAEVSKESGTILVKGMQKVCEQPCLECTALHSGAPCAAFAVPLYRLGLVVLI